MCHVCHGKLLLFVQFCGKDEAANCNLARRFIEFRPQEKIGNLGCQLFSILYGHGEKDLDSLRYQLYQTMLLTNATIANSHQRKEQHITIVIAFIYRPSGGRHLTTIV